MSPNGGAVTGRLHITGNDISTDNVPAGFPAGQAIAVAAAASGSGGAVSTLCADIGGAGANANTITGTWDGLNGDAIRVTTLRGSVFTVGGMPGSGTATVAEVTAFVSGQNGAAPTSGSNTASGGGTFNKNSGNVCSPLLFAPGGVYTNAAQPKGALLSQAALDSTVVTAIQRWEATGLTPHQVATLRGLSFEVADLPGRHLGEANGNHIRVDNNAGGNGWFINSTKDDRQFSKSVSATRSYTEPTSAPAGRVDLLTAIMHEMGHALGLPDTYDAKDRDKVMYGFLTNGERRVPATGDALGAKPSDHPKPQYLAAPAVNDALTIGTIPQGKSVTIRHHSTINNTIPSSGSPISSQGTVSGSNFSNVLTDDPAVGGTADPTLTPVTVPPRSYSAGGPPPATGTVNQPYAGYTFIADGAPRRLTRCRQARCRPG